MTQALNYTTQAIADFRDSAANPYVPKWDADGFRFLADLLDRAQVFLLEDHGELLDRTKPRPQVPGLMYRPPFPVVALEYQANPREGSDPFYESCRCPRRIALAWEWDGVMPSRLPSSDGPAAGEGVAIASLVWSEAGNRWVPVAGAMFIPFDCAYEVAPLTPRRKSLLEAGVITAKQTQTPAIAVTGLLPLLPTVLGQLLARFGEERMYDTISSDLADEAGAYLDLCLALACTNVSSDKIEQAARLNKARIKRGKPPFKDFHVLKIHSADGDGGFSTGNSGGVRSHLRRGHVRRLGPERVTWVNSCMVRGARDGFVKKQYHVGG